MTKEEKVREIITRLDRIWPNPKTELLYSNPWQLLVAVILSAQSTDKSVNKVTPTLFMKFPDVKDFAASSAEEINTLIKTINFHNTKAKNIFNAALIIVRDFNGGVPQTMEELITLPGVARKTANVVLGEGFSKQYGIAVDTHVKRLARSLGLTTENDPVKIEADLMKITPRKYWTKLSHQLVLFGRYYCPAGKKSSECEILGDLCNK